jgi:hypothetical protein
MSETRAKALEDPEVQNILRCVLRLFETGIHEGHPYGSCIAPPPPNHRECNILSTPRSPHPLNLSTSQPLNLPTSKPPGTP